MWTSGIIGLVLCGVGGLWIAQGVGVAKGSFMTGDSAYTVIGSVVVAVGLALLALAEAIRRRRSRRVEPVGPPDAGV